MSMMIDRRGAVAVLAAMMLSVLAGIGALGLNQAGLHGHGLRQRHTTDAAALAAAQTIPTFYTSGTDSTTNIVSAAQTISTANMPTATYGTIVPAGNVVLGNWNASTKTFTARAGSTLPDAVRVTGLASAANGNAITNLMAILGNTGSRTYETTAIASYPRGQTWHTIVTNDTSATLTDYIGTHRAVNKAILDCMQTAAGSGSEFGIIDHAGPSRILQSAIPVSTNYRALSDKIKTLTGCGATWGPGGVGCFGMNLAGALYKARQEFKSERFIGTRKTIVMITQGKISGFGMMDHKKEDGVYWPDGSNTRNCANQQLCTDAELSTAATNQATLAGQEGISVNIIYYPGDSRQANRAANRAAMEKLVNDAGTGVFMNAPAPSNVPNLFGGLCKPSAVLNASN